MDSKKLFKSIILVIAMILCILYSSKVTFAATCSHNWKNLVTVQPTHKTQGYTLQQCTKCKTTRKANTKAIIKNHNFNKIVKDIKSTCTTSGCLVKACTVSGCNEVQVTTRSLTNHSYGPSNEYKAATETETGISRKICKNCGYTLDTVIPKKSHNYVNVETVNASYFTIGYTKKQCKNCNNEIMTNIKPKLVLDDVTEFKYTTDNNKVNLSWSSVINADCYILYELTNTSEVKLIKYVKNTKTTVTQAENSSKRYCVKAYKMSSDNENIATSVNAAQTTVNIRVLTPTKVTKVVTTTPKTAGLKVTWTKASFATSYQITYSINSNFSGSRTVTSKTNSILLKPAHKNTKYYVKVRAIRVKGNVTTRGAYSNSVSGTTSKK